MQHISPARFANTTPAAHRHPVARKLAWAVAMALVFGADCALADLPTGYTAVQGVSSTSSPNANTLQVNVADNKAIINWNSFSISNGNTVQFVQPSSSAITLNRVTGGTSSDIAGSLLANGQIFLVNPNGVFFSSTAQVNVGGLIASTMDIADSNFMNGASYVFTKGSGSPLGQVSNSGSITAANGGYAALFGEQVVNAGTGVISAPGGKVALGVGEKVTVSFDQNQLLSFTVDQRALSAAAQAKNQGQLLADGGSVQMTAWVTNAIAGAAVNQSGVVRALGVSQKNGEVYLSADGGDVEVTGSITVGALTGAPQAQLTLLASNGNITVGNAANINVSGAASNNVSMNASGLVSLGGTLAFQSTEGDTGVALQGNGVALNSANISASGYSSASVSINSGSGAVTQDSGGQLRALTPTANPTSYAYAGLSVTGSGTHNLGGTLEAGSAGPMATSSVSVTSTGGAITVGTISAHADQGGTSSTISLSAATNITTTGNLSNTADAGPASTTIAAGGSVTLGGNLAVQSLSDPNSGSAALASVTATTGDIRMATGTQVSVTDTSTAGTASNGAGLTLSAAHGQVVSGDINVASAAGATQVNVNGAGGVALNGNVAASGQSAVVNVGASGTDIALASGKTVVATSSDSSGSGAVVNVSTPGGSLHIAGSLSTQAPNGGVAQVVTNPALPGTTPVDSATPQLALDAGQSLLSRLLAMARSTPSNPLANNGLIVMPAWDIVGTALRTGGSIDAALFEEDGPDSLNPTSDVQVDAAPVNAAMRK